MPAPASVAITAGRFQPLGVAVRAVGDVERAQVELRLAEDPVVDDQHAGDRAERARRSRRASR